MFSWPLTHYTTVGSITCVYLSLSGSFHFHAVISLEVPENIFFLFPSCDWFLDSYHVWVIHLQSSAVLFELWASLSITSSIHCVIFYVTDLIPALLKHSLTSHLQQCFQTFHFMFYILCWKQMFFFKWHHRWWTHLKHIKGLFLIVMQPLRTFCENQRSTAGNFLLWSRSSIAWNHFNLHLGFMMCSYR